ncbi:hypothetical protein MMC24_001475 [Lignoscripta atroalba]|nr:hypothetical protein [Lignoscripta atroalba]
MFESSKKLFKGNRARSKSDKAIKPDQTVIGDRATAYNTIIARDASSLSQTPPPIHGTAENYANEFVSHSGFGGTSPILRDVSSTPPIPTRRRPFLPASVQSTSKPSSSASSRLRAGSIVVGSRSGNFPAPPAGPPEIPECEIGSKFPSLASSDNSPYRPKIKEHHFSTTRWAEAVKKEGEDRARAELMKGQSVGPLETFKSGTGNDGFRQASKTGNLRRRSASLGSLTSQYPDPGFLANNFPEAASGFNGGSHEPALGSANYHYDRPSPYLPQTTYKQPNAYFGLDSVDAPPGGFPYGSETMLPSTTAGFGDNFHHGNFEDTNVLDNHEARGLQVDSALGDVAHKIGIGYPHGWAQDLTEHRETVERSSEKNMPNTGGEHDDGEEQLGEYAWSPKGSSHSLSSTKGLTILPASTYSPTGFVEGVSYASEPPNTPLPLGPPFPVRHAYFSRRHDETTKSITTRGQSGSSESYGTTRKLLELSNPKIPAINVGVSSAENKGLSIFANLPSPFDALKLQHGDSDAKTSSGLSSTGRDISDRSVARLSVISSDGSYQSRQLSRNEAQAITQTLEQQVNDQLRRRSVLSSNDGRPADVMGDHSNFEHTHRLSIEYSDGDDSVECLQPSNGHSSSSSISRVPVSGRKARLGFHDNEPALISRKGTPPLLFGKGAINTLGHLGDSLTGSHSAGTTSDGRAAGSMAEEDRDWVTDDDNHSFDRFANHGTMGKLGTGSSLADFSDSVSLSPPKQSQGLSGGPPVLQHPVHPRYAHTYNLLKDKRSGEVVLMPEYAFTGGAGFPNRNVVTPPMSKLYDNNPYRHPTPLSKEHTHPFASSPPLVSSERRDRTYNVTPLAEDTDLQTEYVSPGRYNRTGTYGNGRRQNPPQLFEPRGMVVKDGQRDVSYASLRASGIDGSYSNAWLSTVDEVRPNENNEMHTHGNSFSKMTALGPKANITGTPEGTGVREVGSSLADASSPGVKLSSSPMQFSSSPLVRIPLLGEPSSSRFAKSAKSSKGYHRRTIDGSAESLKANSPGDFHERIRNHKIHRDSYLLDDDDELEVFTPMRSNIYPSDVDLHRQHLIDHALLPKNPTPPPGPRRHSAPFETIDLGEPDETTTEAPANLPVGSGRGLSSYIPNLHNMRVRMRSPTRRHVEFEMVTPVTPGGNIPVTSPTDSDNGKNKDSKWMNSKFPQQYRYQVEVGQPHVQTLREWVESRAPTAEDSQEYFSRVASRVTSTAPSRGTDRGIARTDRPVARAESPHLYRIPRPTTSAVLARQQELSRVCLALCCAFPPLLPIFGHGQMDEIMVYLTHGDCAGFCANEKKIALFLGYGLFISLLIALTITALLYYKK